MQSNYMYMYARRQLLFLRENNELPQARFEPATFCMLNRTCTLYLLTILLKFSPHVGRQLYREGAMCPMMCTLSPFRSASSSCSMSHCSWPAGSVLLMSSQLERGREGRREGGREGGGGKRR